MKMRTILIFTVLLMLAGCLSPISTPQIAEYRLDASSQKAIRKIPSSTTLLVSRPVADPGYQSKSMLYIKQPYQLQSFALNEWVMPPANMIQSVILQSLRKSHVFRAVINPPFVGTTDYRLESNLIEFQQNFIHTPSTVKIVLQVNLVDARIGKVIASQRFAVERPTLTNDPYSGVVALNRATQKIMRDLVIWINRHV